MKKVILMLFMGLWGSSLLAQNIPDCDYNPYRHKERKESQKQALEQYYQAFIVEPCNMDFLYELINEFNKTDNLDFLYAISSCNCPEVIDYAKSLIDTSQNENARCIAVGMLGFRQQYNEIPYLLNYLSRTESVLEKIAIAATLAKLGEQTKSKEIFERYCFEVEDMNLQCVLYYSNLDDEQTAIQYFDYFFNKPEFQLEAASWLARLGVYDKTFPLFVEFLNTQTTYERGTVYSLSGLAAIGTPECFEIIKQIANKPCTGLIASTASRTIETIIKERKTKCKE